MRKLFVCRMLCERLRMGGESLRGLAWIGTHGFRLSFII